MTTTQTAIRRLSYFLQYYFLVSFSSINNPRVGNTVRYIVVIMNYSRMKRKFMVVSNEMDRLYQLRLSTVFIKFLNSWISAAIKCVIIIEIYIRLPQQTLPQPLYYRMLNVTLANGILNLTDTSTMLLNSKDLLNFQFTSIIRIILMPICKNIVLQLKFVKFCVCWNTNLVMKSAL